MKQSLPLSIADMRRVVTHGRVGNYALLAGGYHWARHGRTPRQWAMPAALAFEPTTSCNLRCPECPSGLRQFSRPTGMADVQTLETALAQTASHAFYLNLYFQGEPYLNPQFFAMAEAGHRAGLLVSTSTNAHYLTDANCKSTIESGLGRLIVSIDGTTQEVYEQYRIGGNLEKVLAGVRKLVAWKKKLNRGPHIEFQFLVVKPNEHQMEHARQLARELKVDSLVFKTAQIYDYQNGSDLMPANEKYSRYRKGTNGQYEIKNPLKNECWRMWSSCVITWDGRIVPCCFDKDAHHQMGTLKTHSFEEIWHGQAYKNFRLNVARGRDQIEICRNCTEGGEIFSS